MDAVRLFSVSVLKPSIVIPHKLTLSQTRKAQKSGCGCVGHGLGFYVNTSALAANIFFGI